MKSAVEAAKEAYKSWSKTSILTRQQVMFKYQDIIRKNMVGVLFVIHLISSNFDICRESWPKVWLWSRARPWLTPRVTYFEASVRFFLLKENYVLLSTKILEVVEHCCSITSLQQGESLNGIARDMDTHSYRTPIGVCAGIAPFNFPAMIPLWVSQPKSSTLD